MNRNNTREFDLNDLTESYEQSLKLLRSCSTAAGIVASTQRGKNYNRIWARDGIICGLAGLISGNSIVTKSLKHTLINLSKCQGPEGQIPSNISFNKLGKIDEISYGGIVGRVDPTLWFIIGVCNYARFTENTDFAYNLKPVLLKSIELLNAWEFNGKGLLYVPQSGDWMDEQCYHGYILYDQLLRIWALRCYSSLFGDIILEKKAEKITELVRLNFWPAKENENNHAILHKSAFANYLKKHVKPDYACLSLSPGGYFSQFDLLANSLAIFLSVIPKKNINPTVNFVRNSISTFPYSLFPNVWPPVLNSDSAYPGLLINYSEEFRNQPFEYQNGGIWPIGNAFWGMSQFVNNELNSAAQLLLNISVFNRKNKKGEWGFYEFCNSQSGTLNGVKKMAWSAAGFILLYEYLNKKNLFLGNL